MVARPTFLHERELLEKGYRAIVGIDEAGCGALAGPVVAGACILPLNSRIGRLHDSKLFTERVREQMYKEVIQKATSWAVGIVSVEEIMQMGVRTASLEAMRRALDKIAFADYALIDAWTLPNLSISQRGIVKGDRLVKSIAAASIVAKVTRDHIMRQYHEQYPKYGFAKHKGYGTKSHRQMIEEFGPCSIHRLTYKIFQ
ncbi:ribonuclease HII [Patescibacteria group bacterium]|nr:ribonuclease HII [Patescibacteria group bacterium]